MSGDEPMMSHNKPAGKEQVQQTHNTNVEHARKARKACKEHIQQSHDDDVKSAHDGEQEVGQQAGELQSLNCGDSSVVTQGP